MEINKDLETWNEGIKSQKLSSIADVCDQFLLPNFLCPWVCSEFIHKFGYVDLDTVIQQFIQKCNLYILDVSKLSKIEHTHNDYYDKPYTKPRQSKPRLQTPTLCPPLHPEA